MSWTGFRLSSGTTKTSRWSRGRSGALWRISQVGFIGFSTGCDVALSSFFEKKRSSWYFHACVGMSENSIERHVQDEDIKKQQEKLWALEEELHENMMRLSNLANKPKGREEFKSALQFLKFRGWVVDVTMKSVEADDAVMIVSWWLIACCFNGNRSLCINFCCGEAWTADAYFVFCDQNVFRNWDFDSFFFASKFMRPRSP